jgi:hypothetical protein
VNDAIKKLRDGKDGRGGSVDEVLRKVHALEAAVKSQPEVRKTLAALNLTEAYREVEDMPGREVGENLDSDPTQDHTHSAAAQASLSLTRVESEEESLVPLSFPPQYACSCSPPG